MNISESKSKIDNKIDKTSSSEETLEEEGEFL